MALLSSMGTLPYVSAPSRAAVLLIFAASAAACVPGASNNVASHSPSPSPQVSPSASPSAAASPSPQPVTGAYGVLYSSQAASSYTVSIIGIDGKVVGSAQASTPPLPTCANAAAALVSPPVSESNSRAYFEDAAGAVRWLDPRGATSPAPITTLPAPTSSRRSMFAVSPDDAEMAVVVDDFTSSGAVTRLYMYDLNMGGTQKLLYSESGAYSLWPIGWHGANNLVVAKTAACTQGGGPFCCGPLELHVVDPATATRRFTIGSGSSCVIVGPPSPAGAICESRSYDVGTILNWTAVQTGGFPIGGPTVGLLSPNGQLVALPGSGSTAFFRTNTNLNLTACSWIDDTHVLAGGDPQHQPRVGNLSDGSIVPVAAQGDCGGRIPGGL